MHMRASYQSQSQIPIAHKLSISKKHRGIANEQDKYIKSEVRFNPKSKAPIKFHSLSRTIEKSKNTAADTGTFTYKDGKFSGQYILKKHGLGKYEWTNGQTYEGEWMENKIAGFGIYKWPDGRSYLGEWRDNQMHGIGLYQWAETGRKYVGEYVEGKKHGYGIFV